MNNIHIKTWKSLEEQVEILEERGMIINDRDEALHYLRRVGYYRLSGYWYSFRKFKDEGGREDNFIPETHFSDIIKLYDFDRRLRLIALDAIERIELAIQVEISHTLGQRNPLAHLEPKELHGNFFKVNKKGKVKYDEWLQDYSRLVKRSDNKTFVQHNLKKYGQLPIWVATEIWDFGTMSKFYAEMQHKDKLNIEKQFGLNSGTEFQTWLRGFNFIRNIAAHHSRLWNCNVPERARIPRAELNLYKLDRARPFLYFCMMQTVLKIICPQSSWKDNFLNLLNEFPHIENKAVELSDMGIVEGFETWSCWN